MKRARCELCDNKGRSEAKQKTEGKINDVQETLKGQRISTGKAGGGTNCFYRRSVEERQREKRVQGVQRAQGVKRMRDRGSWERRRGDRCRSNEGGGEQQKKDGQEDDDEVEEDEEAKTKRCKVKKRQKDDKGR